ncbi:anaerobic C4-dicarboxylate transporter family protein [Angustibacter sp. McL0619]|uniref:anaerobic C4-dicarboxylate transporter family protein n=1 Tax=Angustibacter sp. McL0619 TaxID=3415676 RepID=UPI003CF6EB2F
MDDLVVVFEGLVVLAAIFLGVRMGGIGLGLWGVAGTAVLVFGFQMDPGSPPVDAFFIIIAVITASSAMQAAGGIDWLVSIASRIIRANPKRITIVAPLVSFVFTVGAGTSNIYFALIPVINETAYRNGIRPERPLASSTVTSALGITASPVSAAMAAYLTLLPDDFTLTDILMITIPASIVACIATSLVQQRIGAELKDDPEYLRLVAAGEVEVPEQVMAELPAETRAAAAAAAARRPASAIVTEERSASEVASDVAHGRTSALIFLAGVAFIVIMGLFEDLRPTVGTGEDAGPLSMTVVIELAMFTVALIILLVGRIAPAKVLEQPLLSAGIVAAIALFGIAWMADTFIAGNPQIIEWMGSVVKDHPLFLAVALFLVCGLTTSQSATTRTLIPIALAAGMSPAIITAMWPSLVGVWLFPANGSQIAAVAIDKTGTTKLSQVPVWHSFTIPMLVSWVSVVAVGLAIAAVVK